MTGKQIDCVTKRMKKNYCAKLTGRHRHRRTNGFPRVRTTARTTKVFITKLVKQLNYNV